MLSVASVAPPAALDADVLACMGSAAIPGEPRGIPHELPVLGPALSEVWRAGAAVESRTQGAVRTSEGGGFLFGSIESAEAGLVDFTAGSREIYAQINALLAHRGYPHLLRCWNYIHDIHRGEGDNERYRQFCLGRHQAVAGADGFERSLPAATVIGSRRPGLQVCFLAGREAGIQVENPRQVPAYRYPREYGPASPSFSRATWLPSQRLLLVSGTASVVGHATRHPGDVAGQSEEVVRNIQALLEQASSVAGVSWAPRSLRAFVRDGSLLESARAALGDAFGAAPLAWFEGDICRRDLLVELDGVFAAA